MGARSRRDASRDATAERTGTRALAGWVLFDWAAQPFYTLVVTFLFAPYFVNGFMADPVRGAALWAYATGIAELDKPHALALECNRSTALEPHPCDKLGTTL